MRRRQLLIVPFLLFSTFLLAQTKPDATDVQIGKYAIRLVVNPDTTYGYEINEGEKIVISQKRKPYGSNQTGFREKQNAMLVAIWLTNELSQGRNNPKTLDLKKAKELGITKDDL